MSSVQSTLLSAVNVGMTPNTQLYFYHRQWEKYAKCSALTLKLFQAAKIYFILDNLHTKFILERAGS